MSFRLRLARLMLRLVIKPQLRRLQDPLQARAQFEASARRFKPPPHLLHLGQDDFLQDITAGPVRRDAVILWLHGGAYLLGSPATHSAMLARLSRLSKLAVFAPNYRVAPEHPAPAAFEDACRAHGILMERGWRPDQIILGGDSAGGGLALALLAELCRRDQRPAAVVALSPWTDLTLQGESLRKNAACDPIFPAERAEFLAGLVLQGFPADDPRISPLFADFSAPPPCLFHVGSDEILLDDTLRIAKRLERAGARVEVKIYPQAPHVWHIMDGFLPEARSALRHIAEFCTDQLPSIDTTR